MAQANGEQAGGRSSTYVVLQKDELLSLVEDLLERAEVEVSEADMAKLEKEVDAEQELFSVYTRLPARNGAHALHQVGRSVPVGTQLPPLVAVSERMFRPRDVNVAYDARVSIT